MQNKYSSMYEKISRNFKGNIKWNGEILGIHELLNSNVAFREIFSWKINALELHK